MDFTYVGFTGYERGDCVCESGAQDAFSKHAFELRKRGATEEEIELSFSYPNDSDWIPCRTVKIPKVRQP
jgi:hypothetical protein